LWIHQTIGMSKSSIPEGYKVVSVGKRLTTQVDLESETAKRAKPSAAPVSTLQASRSASPSGSFCASGIDDEDIASTFIKYGECPMPEAEVDPSVPLKLIKDAPPMERTYSQSLSDSSVLPSAQDEEVRGIMARISAEHKAVKAETLATGRSDEKHLRAIVGLVNPTPADFDFERQIADRMRVIAAHHGDDSGPAPSMEALQSLSRENLKTIADMVVDHMKQHPNSIFSTAAHALDGSLDFAKKARADEASEWKD
jgi:hypothetical protein